MNVLNQELKALQYTIEYYTDKRIILYNKLKSEDLTIQEVDKINELISWYTQQIEKAEYEVQVRLNESKDY